MILTCIHGKFDTSTRRGKVTVSGNTAYCSIDNFKRYANAQGFFCYAHDDNVTVNTSAVTTSTYTRYVSTNSKNLNVRNSANGSIIGSLSKGTQVTVAETQGSWSRITSPISGWVSSNYLTSYVSTSKTTITGYRTGTYKVTKVSKNSRLNVRYGVGTKYSAKTYTQLTANARQQNANLGNAYCNGYMNGVVCTITKVSGNWGLTASGWICLDFCTKL